MLSTVMFVISMVFLGIVLFKVSKIEKTVDVKNVNRQVINHDFDIFRGYVQEDMNIQLTSMKNEMNERFNMIKDETDERFGIVDDKFNKLTDEMNNRFKEVDRQFELVREEALIDRNNTKILIEQVTNMNNDLDYIKIILEDIRGIKKQELIKHQQERNLRLVNSKKVGNGD